MNTHDIDIELPAEFRSGNSIPVERATITRERMTEILQDAIEADRQSTAELLKNPIHVHTNMCRGIIAPITFDMLAHVLGDEATNEWLRKRRGEPVAWIQRTYLNLIRESNVALHNVFVRGSIRDGDGDVVPLFTAPQPAEPVKLDRYDAGYLGGQDGMPAHVWHDIIRSELDRAYYFYMDQLDRAGPQPTESVKYCTHPICRGAGTTCTGVCSERFSEPDKYCTHPICRGAGTTCTGVCSERFSATQPAEPVKHKRQYAQGTALGEFGIIPMCDQVDDEPVKVPSDDEIMSVVRYSTVGSAAIQDDEWCAFARAILARYGNAAQPIDPANDNPTPEEEEAWQQIEKKK